MTILIPTKNLHGALKLLIKGLREGGGKHAVDAVVVDSLPGMATRQARRYAPREVRFELYAGKQVKVNVQAFSLNAVNGKEVSRGESVTHMDSGGEPNYETLVTYDGPVVAHYGYTQRDARVVVKIPMGIEVPEHGISNAFYDAQSYYQRLADKKDWTAFFPAVDAALEGAPIPFEAMTAGPRAPHFASSSLHKLAKEG